MSIVDVNGVRTWYHDQGAGEPLVLLHPGGTDSRAFEPMLDAFAAKFHVFTPDRRGHGRTPDVGPITFELMAEDTIHFIERVVGGPTRLLGWSDGAIVALLVALRRPDFVSRLVFVGGVFHHEGWLPGVIDPRNTPPDFMAVSYGEVSPDGADHWATVVDKLARLHLVEPALRRKALVAVTTRALVLMGDDDEVALDHAIDLYRGLPDAELAIVPGTSHGALIEKPELCNAIVLDFLCNDPVETLAPIRRARARPGTSSTREGEAQ